MEFLTANELKSKFYTKASSIDTGDVTQFLSMANAYAFGVIGGNPPDIVGDDKKALKSAVALAFQLFAKGDTAQVNDVTGFITEAAPAGAFVRNQERDPWKLVDAMLKPYVDAYAAGKVIPSNNGVRFL